MVGVAWYNWQFGDYEISQRKKRLIVKKYFLIGEENVSEIRGLSGLSDGL